MTTATIPSPPELNTLRLEVDGEIGTLTLDRPEVLNAMSPELIGELVIAAAWLADRAPLRALIVTGAGRAFSAGGDVNWFKRGLDESERRSVGRGAARSRRPAPGDRRLQANPLSGDRGGQRRRGGGRVLAGADVRHADRLRGGGVRVRLRADRSLAGRGNDLLPPPDARTRAGDRAAAQRPAAERRAGARDGNRRRGGGRRRADRSGPREGGEAGREGAPLRSDLEAA